MLLEDLHHIRTVDKGNMMARIVGLPQQIRGTRESMSRMHIPEEYSDCEYVLAVGMGGSGIPGDFLRTIYRDQCSRPVFVHKDYSLPAFVNSNTLVLAVSYSGTTEETIDAFSEALKRGAKIFGISSGDKLLALLRENELPHFAPPAGRTTRECIGYLLFSMITVLEQLGYVPDQSTDIADTVSLLDKLSSTYSSDTPTDYNGAKRIASRLHDAIPVLYGSADLTDVVALRWKQQINENSKEVAQIETFPDLTHNLLATIERPSGIERQICPVILRNQNERSELSRRIDATKEVFEGKGMEVIEHWAEGTSLLSSLLSQSYLGDFVSVYLAVLNGVDPTPTAAMSKLKELLGLTDLTPL